MRRESRAGKRNGLLELVTSDRLVTGGIAEISLENGAVSGLEGGVSICESDAKL
jgi:hypothetical protein